jgi:hypothetical protein
LRQRVELLPRNISEPQRDFLRAGDAQALSLLQNLDEVARLDQRGMGAGVEPGKAAAEQLHEEIAAIEVGAVDIGNLDLAARRRADRRGDFDHGVVVEIKPGDCNVRLRFRGFLLDGNGAPGVIELHHPVALRIGDRVSEHRRSAWTAGCLEQLIRQPVAVKDVVAEDQRDVILADEVAPDNEGVGDPAGIVLRGVGERQAEFGAVAQEPPEQRQVFWRRDDQNVANAGKHQHRQRIVDHGLVEDGQQLLGDDRRNGVETRAAPPGEYDPLHDARSGLPMQHFHSK